MQQMLQCRFDLMHVMIDDTDAIMEHHINRSTWCFERASWPSHTAFCGAGST